MESISFFFFNFILNEDQKSDAKIQILYFVWFLKDFFFFLSFAFFFFLFFSL